MKRSILLFCAVILFASCDKKHEEPIPEKSQQLQIQKELNDVSNVRDSLLQVVAESAKLINEVDAELARISEAPAGTLSPASKQSIKDRLFALDVKIAKNKKQMAALQQKIKKATGQNNELSAQVATLAQIVDEHQKTVESQSARIADLEFQLGVLAEDKKRISDSLSEERTVRTEIENDKNTAYIVVGTIDELEEKGIIRKEGKTLFFGGRWVPVPTADLSLFTKIDIRKKQSIELPPGMVLEKVISAHNSKFLEADPATAGPPMLNITKPEQFWKTDRQLIIAVESK
jgi:chaperonin cofactor prefoldin